MRRLRRVMGYALLLAEVAALTLIVIGVRALFR
jgi:hypothetical protein